MFDIKGTSYRFFEEMHNYYKKNILGMTRYYQIVIKCSLRIFLPAYFSKRFIDDSSKMNELQIHIYSVKSIKQ